MRRVASRQNVSIRGGRSFGFLPQVGAFGVVDRAEDAFFGKGDFFAYRFYEVFHILALGGVICGTGIFDDGERPPHTDTFCREATRSIKIQPTLLLQKRRFMRRFVQIKAASGQYLP